MNEGLQKPNSLLIVNKSLTRMLSVESKNCVGEVGSINTPEKDFPKKLQRSFCRAEVDGSHNYLAISGELRQMERYFLGQVRVECV